MDKSTAAVLAAGLVATAALYFVSIYLAGVAIIIVAAIVMSLLIMQDTRNRPQIDARLREDAKGIVITNTGNAPAEQIHVALVPLNIEYDIPALSVDASHEHLLPSMIPEVKVVVTYRNGKGQEFTHSFPLSSAGGFDPLKPMIPIFSWK